MFLLVGTLQVVMSVSANFAPAEKLMGEKLVQTIDAVGENLDIGLYTGKSAMAFYLELQESNDLLKDAIQKLNSTMDFILSGNELGQEWVRKTDEEVVIVKEDWFYKYTRKEFEHVRDAFGLALTEALPPLNLQEYLPVLQSCKEIPSSDTKKGILEREIDSCLTNVANIFFVRKEYLRNNCASIIDEVASLYKTYEESNLSEDAWNSIVKDAVSTMAQRLADKLSKDSDTGMKRSETSLGTDTDEEDVFEDPEKDRQRFYKNTTRSQDDEDLFTYLRNRAKQK